MITIMLVMLLMIIGNDNGSNVMVKLAEHKEHTMPYHDNSNGNAANTPLVPSVRTGDGPVGQPESA